MLIRLAVLSSLLINLSLQANPARHQPSFLFISAEFPPHQPHPHFVPHPSNSPAPVARQYHGGSYGINKSGAHAPQRPSLVSLTLHTLNFIYMCKHPQLQITHNFRSHTSRIPLLSSSIESRQLPPYSSSAKLPLKLYRKHLCIGCPESMMFSNEIFRKKVKGPWELS